MKISGRAEGRTSLVILVQVFIFRTLDTDTRSLSIEATPSAVLISVGHNEHKVTVMAEIRKDLLNSAPSVATVAETIMVTMGSQASGDTGLKIWTSGLIAAFAVLERPAKIPNGIATIEARRKPKNTVWIEVQICA